MKIVIIGAGNVATNLGKALHDAKFQILQVWSQHYGNASTLAKSIAAEPIAELSALSTTADLYIVSVKDDAIVPVLNQLITVNGIVVHTAGTVDLSVFPHELSNHGVLYPLQTFSKGRAVNFEQIPICLEASNEQTLTILSQVARALSDDVREISSERRLLLHVAAVFACNFTNHMYTLAGEILKAYNLEFDILRPLIAETADKVQHHLPQEVQTGPAVRNDQQTMIKHEALLANKATHLAIYKTLSESIKKNNS